MSVFDIGLESQEHLLRRLVRERRRGRRDVVLLVGSPLSLPGDGEPGVPGLNGMVELVQEALKDDPEELAELEERITRLEGGDLYQAALDYLQLAAGQKEVDHVVRTAVLQALRPGSRPAGPGNLSEEECRDLEMKPAIWGLRSGPKALGEMLAGNADGFFGPVLTTNFDPLIEVAIRRAAGTPTRIALDTDGNPMLAETTGTQRVVHLHGYWYGASTLHTPLQLKGHRPQLRRFLEEILTDQMVVVVAYGGWEDVFTKALISLQESRPSLELLWTFHEGDPDTARARNHRLLERLRSAAGGGARFFYGVDVHDFFPSLKESLRTGSATVVARSAAAPDPNRLSPKLEPPLLKGWERIDRAFLEGEVSDLSPQDVLDYFDGRDPTWAHAASPGVPRRRLVEHIAQGLRNAGSERLGATLHLLTGPGGEGKSTICRQIAVELVHGPEDWQVLWRSEPGTRLQAEDLRRLPGAGRPWLLVSDDAHELVGDLEGVLRALHESRRHDIHFLLCARSADWNLAGGSKLTPGKWIRASTHVVGALSGEDALSLVRAWESIGPAGLRELATIPAEEDRVRALLDAATQEAAESRGAGLLGAMLRVRQGEAVDAHVQSLMAEFSEHDLPSGYKLLDAYVFVACLQALGVKATNEGILAEALEIDLPRLRTDVLVPLGREVERVRVRDGNRLLLIRHDAIARTASHLAWTAFGLDEETFVREIVQAAVRTQARGIWVHNFGQVRHLSKRLSAEGNLKLGLVAARAVLDADPADLYSMTSYARALRDTKKPAYVDEAAILVRSHLKREGKSKDFKTLLRGLCQELAAVEGNRGNYALNAWLSGASISDELNAEPVTNEHARQALASVGYALGQLMETKPDLELARAQRATATLGYQLDLNTTTRGYFDRHCREAEQLGATETTVPQAFADLQQGLRKVRKMVEGEIPPLVPQKPVLGFSSLNVCLSTTRKRR